MKVGINILHYGQGADPRSIESWVLRAEERGFHLAMISDHVTLPAEVAEKFPPPFYDPLTTLAWLAGRTTSIRLGTTVLILPYRHPLHVARVAANIDRFSGGRLVLGVGAGWSPQEFAALGVDFAARGEITDEYLTCIKEHWSKPAISMRGRHVSFDEVATGPAPIQRPHPPLWVGGLGDAALRRAVRFGDAWHPYNLTLDDLRRRGKTLAAFAEQAGGTPPPTVPRIALHLTEESVPEEVRTLGHGTLDQVRADLEGLAELDVPYVVLDPYLTTYLGLVPPERGPRHDPRQLDLVAERLFDLARETPR